MKNKNLEKNSMILENDKAIQSISIIREGNHKGLPLRINDDEFKNKHRTASKFL
ncbi:MAG: hypothetical protein ABFS56_31560 [Pseudomonadota bacterium]